MENKPLVSVIMPAYNAARDIEKAIRSVMAQTVTDWELLVMDDASSDETAQIVKGLAMEDDRIQYHLSQENIGCAGVRNLGFDLCRGQYVALLDSDDIWLPEKLEKQLALAEKTGAGLLYTSYGIMDVQEKAVRADYLVPETVDFKSLLGENVIGCSTVMLKGELVKKFHFERNFYHEDYALWLALLRSGVKAAGCREVLVRWRYAANSRSFNKVQSAKNRWKIYRHYLKLPLAQSAWHFCEYVIASLKKYGKSA
jgi:teichuronic acid biosynthesis glycosyltransferase TuaG